MKKMFLLLDGRANPVDGTCVALVLTCSRTLGEARADAHGCGECHIWEYDEDDSKDPPQLINERFVETRNAGAPVEAGDSDGQ